MPKNTNSNNWNWKSYWKPRYRSEYVNWLSDRYPSNKYKFKRMNIDQLKIIYNTVRKEFTLSEDKEVNGNEEK